MKLAAQSPVWAHIRGKILLTIEKVTEEADTPSDEKDTTQCQQP